MILKKQVIPIVIVFLTILACNTLFPDLPQNTAPDAGSNVPRRSGECTDQRFKDAELAAYQTMLQERAAATEAFDKKITEIENAYNTKKLDIRATYDKALNACTDAGCSEAAKKKYDSDIEVEQIDQGEKRIIAEDVEQTAIEQAQDNYNAAVDDARQKYCTPSYTATGQVYEAKFSGVICSLALPFTLDVNAPYVSYKLEFTPASLTAGTYTFEWQKEVTSTTGKGTYTVTGLDTDKTIITASGDATGVISLGSDTEGGAVIINLVPLETSVCN